jgi:hypothetical protein
VLSGRNLCDGSITRLAEFYRVLWPECDREASIMRYWPTMSITPRKGNCTPKWYSLKYKNRFWIILEDNSAPCARSVSGCNMW